MPETKYDYCKELQMLLKREFKTEIDAKIALVKFQMTANAAGYRGKELTTQNNRIVQR